MVFRSGDTISEPLRDGYAEDVQRAVAFLVITPSQKHPFPGLCEQFLYPICSGGSRKHFDRRST